MGFFKKLLGGTENAAENTPSVETEKNTVYSPLDGTAITLKEIGDGVFSEGVLGLGCGIRPDSDTVTAPTDGKIIQVADTKHAIGIESPDGLEILIHVGIDTVAMNGKGFTVFVKEGQQVKCGQKLLSFDKKAIAAAGYPDTTAVLITNSSDYGNVNLCVSGHVKSTEKLLKVR